MTAHDFQCLRCGKVFELFLDYALNTVNCRYECGGIAQRVWLKAPGVIGDITPGYDIQLGKYVSSRQERDRILKERGLVAIGPDESRRWDNVRHEAPDPPMDRARLVDAYEKAVSDHVNGRVAPVETRPAPEIDILADGGSAITSLE